MVWSIVLRVGEPYPDIYTAPETRPVRRACVLQGGREPANDKAVELRLRHVAHDEPIDDLDVAEGIRSGGEVVLNRQPFLRLLGAHIAMLPHTAACPAARRRGHATIPLAAGDDPEGRSPDQPG